MIIFLQENNLSTYVVQVLKCLYSISSCLFMIDLVTNISKSLIATYSFNFKKSKDLFVTTILPLLFPTACLNSRLSESLFVIACLASDESQELFVTFLVTEIRTTHPQYSVCEKEGYIVDHHHLCQGQRAISLIVIIHSISVSVLPRVIRVHNDKPWWIININKNTLTATYQPSYLSTNFFKALSAISLSTYLSVIAPTNDLIRHNMNMK